MDKQPPEWAVAFMESQGFEGAHATELARRLVANEEIDYQAEHRKASHRRLVQDGYIDPVTMAVYEANSQVVSAEETARLNREANAKMPKTVLHVGTAIGGEPVMVTNRPADDPSPRWTPRVPAMADVARSFARRPQGRAPRRATVRRPSRAGSRAAPSDLGSDPPPRRRLLRILDRIIAGWLGLAAFERRLAELDRETTRRLRGGA